MTQTTLEIGNFNKANTVLEAITKQILGEKLSHTWLHVCTKM